MRHLFNALIGCMLLIFFCSSSFAVTPKQWTFLIFINGNNSLDSFGESNILDMEKVGSDDQVNVVVQWASMGRSKTYRMLIQKSTNPGEVTSPVVQELADVDMGDAKSLDDFIAWGVQNYPADHYFVDVWNHGSGWHNLKKGHHGAVKPSFDISNDDKTGHSITTEQLGQSMSKAASLMGHKVDIYGSDACLMAMPEIAHEMSNAVSYFVGSEELEPAAGWPYEALLAQWEAIPNANAEQVATILVNAYLKYYDSGDSSPFGSHVTLSAFDLSKLPALDNAMAKLGVELRSLNAEDKAKIQQISSSQVQRFGIWDYADLIDLTQYLSGLKLSTLNPDVIAGVEAAAKQLVVANGSSIQHAFGVSIWLPESQSTYDEFAVRYRGLVFNNETQWGDTLAYLVQGG